MAPTDTDQMRLPDPKMVDSTDGVSLAIYDLGGEGPDVLFAHATGFCAGVFLPIMTHLRSARIVALDFRGHGRSSAPQTSMDWQGTAQDLLVTIESLGLKRPFGVGHSMGGAALVLAEQSRPGSFRGLWLYEPIIFPPEIRQLDGGNPLVDGALRRRSTFESAASAVENFSSKPPLDVLAPESLDAYVRYGFKESPGGSVSLRCRPETEASTYEMGARHDAFDRLGDIEPPVTVLRGVETPMTPAQIAPMVAERLPAGRLEAHDELGHFGPLENPDSMTRSIDLAVTASI